MYNDSSSSPTLTDATFSSNTAGELGGAMYNDNSSNLTLTNITFSNNTAGDQGGAMYNENSSLTLTNVTFSGNTAIFGGAMSNNNSNNLTLTNVTFSGNMAGDEGGAMYNTGSSPTLTNVTFSSNSASNLGGAMYNYNSSPTLTNATFSGNTAGGQGGAMYNTGSSPTLTNVILWGNTATNSGSQISQNGGTLTINYSIVEGGDTGLENSTAFSSGTGNSDADPLFTDADGPDDTLGTLDDDLSLQACSPAIDAGDNDAISLTTDLAGNPRKVEDTGVDDTGNGTVPIVDIGALEFQGASQSCTIYYVDASAGGANNGATWADAFPNLQDALQAWRNAGDASSEIWIADGTYYPDEGAATDRTGVTLASPDNNRDATFFVSEGIKIYGGFTGGETNRSERNPAANVVTLSGDTDGDNASGSNAYHVMYLDGSTTAITSATVIDGVTVTAGQADRSFPDYPGGGMLNDSSSPTLTNITFSGNTATDGGAMYNRFSSPTLTNVTFSGNTASSDGGAMYNDSSSPTLTNITFSGNTATDGGAMYNYDDSATTLTNVTFSGNSASNDGGAMYNDENIDESSPTLTNVTFSGNMASRDGGAMYNYESGPTLTNVILWGNTATNSGSQISQDGTLTINYSIVEGGDTGLENSTAFSSGTGNSDADPLFTDADGPDDTLGTLDDDLSLQACSPAIDAGDNTAISLTTDLAGNPRKVDDTGVADINSGTAPIVDIGAFEFQGTSTNCP
ncbi:MAG: choice-of-anchor Q domain-containing protein [Trueperaceae bacterium]|nr:choice-of-anchor Q domain-containing protein [Trueperaceae bacterium]